MAFLDETGLAHLWDKILDALSKKAAADEVSSHVDNATAHVPSCSASDDGKFLRVVDGAAVWTTIENAEGVSF